MMCVNIDLNLQELLRDKRAVKEPCYDLASTQFVIHYSCDTFESADRFLRNAAEFLRVAVAIFHRHYNQLV